MDFSKVIISRYSCKKFDGRAIDADKLTYILEAGRVAPTAKNLQEQHIYVLQTPDSLAKVDEACPCRYNAGTVLVVTYNSKNVFTYPNGTADSGAEDATIVATHMILAATDIGVDSCWLNFFDEAKLAKSLELSADERILMLMDLGYAAENSEPLPNHFKRKELSETVTYI